MTTIVTRKPSAVIVTRNPSQVVVHRPYCTVTGSSTPGGGTTYVHDQPVAAATWTITHNLNNYPSVTVVDSAGSVVVGNAIYDDNNQITLSFTAAFAGKAFLN